MKMDFDFWRNANKLIEKNNNSNLMMRDDYKIIGLSFGSTSPVSNPQILPNHEASWPVAILIASKPVKKVRKENVLRF